MFTQVSVAKSPSPGAHPIPPSQIDCSQVLTLINQCHFFMRELPTGGLSNTIQKVWDQQAQQVGILNCHSVADAAQQHLSLFKWQRVSGYLIRNSVDMDFLQIKRHRSPPHFTISSSGNFITWLHHHSVLVDGQGKYIECLPSSFYPIDEFVFVPHPSGSKGYFLCAK